MMITVALHMIASNTMSKRYRTVMAGLFKYGFTAASVCAVGNQEDPADNVTECGYEKNKQFIFESSESSG